MRRERLSVVANEQVGPYTLLRVARGGIDPGVPGQFFMLEAPGRLLPRPMSLCLAPRGELAFLIDPIGPGTTALCELESGEALHVFGPLGNGFALDLERPLLVGGGIGIAPLPYLSEALGRPPAVLGFRSDLHAQAAELVPNAQAYVEPTPRDPADPGRDGRPGLRARADVAGGASSGANRSAGLGGADGLRLRGLLRVCGGDRRRAEAPVRRGTSAPCCLTLQGVWTHSLRPTSRAVSTRS